MLYVLPCTSSSLYLFDLCCLSISFGGCREESRTKSVLSCYVMHVYLLVLLLIVHSLKQNNVEKNLMKPQKKNIRWMKFSSDI